MSRDPRVQKLEYLLKERRTRAAGRFYGTQATAYGDVRRGPEPRDVGRTLLALVLLIGLLLLLLVIGALLYTLEQADVATWVHAIMHALNLSGSAVRPPHR